MLKTLIMGATALIGLTGTAGAAETDSAPFIDRPDFKSSTGIFDIDALESLGRVASPVVSPDGTKVLYSITYVSVEQNKSNADLYALNLKTNETERLTHTPKSESSAVWVENGSKIAFIYPDESGIPQLWVSDSDGKGRTQLTSLDDGVQGFLFSPDEKKVVIVRNIKYARTAGDIYPDLPMATGKVIDDLMYRHWDEWVTEIPHPFVGDYTGSEVVNLKDIMIDEPFEAPMKPFGGVEQLAWTPDSKGLVYTSRKKTGLDYAVSTNSDLYLYDMASGATKNLTEGMMGYDTNPSFSPDGRYMAWLSMERDGYEADKNRLFIMDMQTGEKKDLTKDWDYTIEEFAWRPDSKSIVFISYYQGGAPVFEISLKDSSVKTLDEGLYDYTGLAVVDNNRVVTLRHSMVRPNEMYLVTNKPSKKTPAATALTDVNEYIFSQLTMPEVKKVMVPTTDGKEMLTWAVYPPKFDNTKKYPAILYCQGGPQSAVSQFWSYRWNFALMASNGYIIIAPNRRGVPGFGTEWEEQISKDYPGQNMKDYLSAVDYMKKAEPAIDSKRIGATGASYGGFSIY
ncbi:MAG: prolyl oligopeptidase family serine peptidase, partial [Muribaculaceae bacterium]|nr:prolyl oligopeptidase family serine peptidase [Muribaculaceae bacterium]